MSLTVLGLGAAFGAGLLSFLAPCVLPLVPSYLSYLARASVEATPTPTRWQVSLHALWFVLGFALLFTLLGATIVVFDSSLQAYQSVLERIGGLLLILFGVALTGLLPIPWLSRDYRVPVQSGPSAWWRSGLIGMAFGASWSACTGPILGSILVLTAIRSGFVLQGALVMLAFSLGLGVPFLLVGLLIDRAGPVLHYIRRYTMIFSTVGGGILILLGIFLVTGLFSTAG